MKKKLLPSDFSDFLAKRENIGKKEADAFVRAFFEVVEQGLLEDRFVKIKGFGTFKLVTVSERESVNINTGERFQISGHSKVSFTPDASMKELVNRPFAHFESVDLGDETEIEELDAIDNSTLLELEVEDSEDAPLTPEEEAAIITEEVPAPAEEVEVPMEVNTTPLIPETEDEPANDSPTEPTDNADDAVVIALEEADAAIAATAEGEDAEPETTVPADEASDETPIIDEPQAEAETETEDTKASTTMGYVYQEVPTPHKPNRWKVAVIIIGVIALMAISYYAGYFRILCPNCPEAVKPVPQKVQPTPQPDKPKPAPAVAQKPDTLATKAANDSVAAVPTPVKAAAEAPKPSTAKATDKAAQAQAKLAPVRIRTHKVKLGENLHQISRKYYGSDKYVNAIIKANNIKDANTINVGTTLKLP